MPADLIVACAELKAAMSNEYAVERYVIRKSPNYTHPGWTEQHKQKKRRKSHGNC